MDSPPESPLKICTFNLGVLVIQRKSDDGRCVIFASFAPRRVPRWEILLGSDEKQTKVALAIILSSFGGLIMVKCGGAWVLQTCLWGLPQFRFGSSELSCLAVVPHELLLLSSSFSSSRRRATRNSIKSHATRTTTAGRQCRTTLQPKPN